MKIQLIFLHIQKGSFLELGLDRRVLTKNKRRGIDRERREREGTLNWADGVSLRFGRELLRSALSTRSDVLFTRP